MTKKDYILIANAINSTTMHKESYTNIGIEHTKIVLCKPCLLKYLAEVMEKDNPKFDKDKFIKACSLND